MALVIYKKQRGIAGNQSTILTDVEGMVLKLNTREAVDKNVRAFFRIYDENASEYMCIYPFIGNKTPIPDLRMGDSYSVSTIKSLLELKEHPCKLQGIERSPDNRENYPVDEDLNYVIVCANLLDVKNPGIPFPEIKNHPDKYLDEITNNGTKGFPCWFVKGKRTVDKTINGERRTEDIEAVAISINGRVPMYSELDTPYTYEIDETEVSFSDLAIISRIKVENRYFILVAGIHNIGSWLAVKYLYKVINNKIEAPEAFLSDDDFIAVIEGDYSLERKWIDRAELRPGCFWSRKSSAINSEWRCISDK